MRLTPETRVAILLHEGLKGPSGKTGLSLLRYGEYPIVAVIDQACAGGSLLELTGISREVPIVASVTAALEYHPQVLAIGIAPSGGALPEPWHQEVSQAVAQGLSVVNGLHTPMAQDPQLKAQLRPGQWIWDLRQEPEGLSVGTAQARTLSCRRVLAVGTDMAVGKMSTCIELHRAAQRRGLRSRFLATGQTGLMLFGEGIPLDAVRVDFASGAVEQVVMHQGLDHDILFIEGQGSLIHPSSTATLPLIRGSQPTHLILGHRAGQTHIHHLPEILIPPLPEVIHLYETVARASSAFTPVRIAGISLNTGHLTPTEALDWIDTVTRETGLPCTDPIRLGVEPLIASLLEE